MTTSLDAVTAPATTYLTSDEIQVLGSALAALQSIAERHSQATYTGSHLAPQYHGRIAATMDAAGAALTNALISQKVYGMDEGGQTALDAKYPEDDAS